VTFLRSFLRDEAGGPAAEMALMLPMLLALLFGGSEGGYFFWREHQVVKAVREAARYASRQPFDKFDCTEGTIDPDTVSGITSAASANLVEVPTVSATVSCVADSDSGIYGTMPGGAPLVQVTVQVPYRGLYSTMYLPGDLTLNARAQALVMGL